MRKFIASVILSVMLFPMTVTAQGKDTYISEEIQLYCLEVGEQYNVCYEILLAMIERESSGNPDAVNGNCKGLLQVSEKWHKGRMEKLGVTDLYDPYSNILVATDYLVELWERHGDVYTVLMCYNMGEKRALELVEQGKYSKYAIGICERSEELERLHERRD